MQNAIHKAREFHQKAIEQLYEDTCTVVEYKSVTNVETKRTSRQEVIVFEDKPCKLSFESMLTTTAGDGAAEQKISAKLFIAPDVTIKPGSKILITHEGETTAYSNSGVPGKFFTHQEIELKLFERWA